MLDYSSPAHQLYALLHFGFAFVLLMYLWPRFFLAGSSGDRMEEWFGRYSIAVCIYIAMGYFLVTIHLYEVISICLVLLLLSTRKYWKKGSVDERVKVATTYSVWFYELTEIGFRIRTSLNNRLGKLTMIRKEIRLKNIVKSNPLSFIFLGCVLAASAYVRFYDAVHHAPPAMSDGVITLLWIKFINNQILFEGGIYPKGFHIYMSLLSKFAAIDELYILKYTGPLNGVLTTLGFYFVLSRMTANKSAGIIGAAMFGFGGYFWFGTDWERQAATNAQEFGMVFVFPALYFFMRYLENGIRRNLWNGTAACACAGFVHTLMFAYTGLGIGVALIACFLTFSFRYWKRMLAVCIFAIASVVVTYAPIQIGELAGIELHSTSASFLTEKATVNYPDLYIRDYIGLCSIGIIALSSFIAWKDRSRRLFEWFVVGIGVATFMLYYWVPHETQSVMLSVRTIFLWSTYTCFSLGMAWWSIWRFIPNLRGVRLTQLVLSGIAAVSFAIYAQLQPIDVYKMQWESQARAYLKIASMHQPMTWTIFSNTQDYALVYGKSFHQYLETLVKEYDPSGTPITRVGQDEYDPDVTPWMYVIQEKEVYKVDSSNSVYSIMQEQYAYEEQANRDLEEWISKYEQFHGGLPIVYEDEHLRVYLIERPDAKDKTVRRLWGTS